MTPANSGASEIRQISTGTLNVSLSPAVIPVEFQPPGNPTACRYFCSPQSDELTKSN
jgi:hypothetical protein